MAKITVGIVAHKLRAEQVRRLQVSLWGHDPVIAWDQLDNEWDTHERAWRETAEQATRTGASHVLILQDDAVPCRFLIPGLQFALEDSRGSVVDQFPISLYFGNALSHPKIVRAAKRADEVKASWIVSSGVWWGVAVMLPVELVDDMLEFCCPRRELYDRRLSIWCEKRGHPVFYPWPSLVDHLDGPSLVNPGRRPGRKAIKFVGEDFSALSFEPAGPMVGCGRLSESIGTRLAGGC